MGTNKLWEFPVPSTGIAEGGVKLIYPGGDAWLLFDYFMKIKTMMYIIQGLFLMLCKHIDITRNKL